MGEEMCFELSFLFLKDCHIHLKLFTKNKRVFGVLIQCTASRTKLCVFKSSIDHFDADWDHFISIPPFSKIPVLSYTKEIINEIISVCFDESKKGVFIWSKIGTPLIKHPLPELMTLSLSPSFSRYFQDMKYPSYLVQSLNISNEYPPGVEKYARNNS